MRSTRSGRPRGDRFDAVFDQSLTVWEALTRIARYGRALPFLQGGTLRIARDAPRTLPVALFGPRNIVQGQLSGPVCHAGRGHGRCRDRDVLLRAHLGARRDHGKPAGQHRRGHRQARQGRIVGCTGAEQAEREGLYMAAANRYRRRIVTFRTELEGLIPISLRTAEQ